MATSTPPIVAPPATPTPPEKIAEALERMEPLQGLSLEDRLWLARNGQEFAGEAGDVLWEEGAPADRMILILKGEIHVRRLHSGPVALFIGRAGAMTGLLPFSRMKASGGQGFAVSHVWGLFIHKDLFPAMLSAIPSMAQRCASTLLDRVREVTRIEQQAEKLAALGQLAGNLSHELNNPASAAQRAAATLLSALRANRSNRINLITLRLTEEQMEKVVAWEEKIFSRSGETLDPPSETDALGFIGREESLRAWLTSVGCGDAWEVAAQLAEQFVTIADLDELREYLSPAEACVVLQYFARYLRSARAAETIVNSTARIFDLIGAVKDYSNMDRAPILEVDVPAGLDATLQMLASRMTHIELEREYQP